MHYKKITRKGWLFGEAFEGKDFDVKIIGWKETKSQFAETDEDTCIALKLAKTPSLLECNNTICETLDTLTGSPDPDDWVGYTITLYPLPGVWFGKARVGIRVRSVLPQQGTEEQS